MHRKSRPECFYPTRLCNIDLQFVERANSSGRTGSDIQNPTNHVQQIGPVPKRG